MSKIKSILAFAALMLCGGAWADITEGTSGNPFVLTEDTTLPAAAGTYYINTSGYKLNTPAGYFATVNGTTVTVAASSGATATASMVWDRDFTYGRTDENGVNWSFYKPNGVTTSTTGVTIGGSGGATLLARTRNASLTGVMSIIIRAKGISVDSSNHRVLIMPKQGDTSLGATLTSGGVYGRQWSANRNNVSYDWSTRTSPTTTDYPLATGESEDTFVLTYEYSSSNNKGTAFYKVIGERTVAKLWAETGLQGSGLNGFNELSLLGSWGANSCNGATLTGVAVFNNKSISAEQIANFVWTTKDPNPATCVAGENEYTYCDYIKATSTLIWPGLTLNDIKDYVFAGTMNGNYVAAEGGAGNGKIGYWNDAGSIVEKTVNHDNIVLKFTKTNENKIVTVTLTETENGICASAAASGAGSTLATDDETNGYGIKMLKAIKDPAGIGTAPYHWYKFDNNKANSGLVPIQFNGNHPGDGSKTPYCVGSRGGSANTAMNVADSNADTWYREVYYGSGEWTAVTTLKMKTNDLSGKVLVGLGSQTGWCDTGFTHSGVLLKGNKTSENVPTVTIEAWTGGNSTTLVSETVEVADATDVYHVYAVVRGESDTKLYIDGVLKATLNITPTPNKTVQFGGVHGGKGTGFSADRGGVFIEDWCVYQKALTVAQLATIGSSYAVAQVGSDNYYATLKAALNAASGETPKTVKLLAAHAGAITIPENVTLDLNRQSFTGAISGAGEIVYDANGGTTVPGFTLDNSWTGLVTIKNFGTIGDGVSGHNQNVTWTNLSDLFNKVGNKVKFIGVCGYYTGDNGTCDLILENGGTSREWGWRNDNGSSSGSATFKSLSGSGKFMDTFSCTQSMIFKDASNFTGTIEAFASGKKYTLGADTMHAGAQNGTIYVDGNIKGATFNGNTVIADGITIDLTDGPMTISSGKTVTFGNTLTVSGTNLNEGDTVVSVANFTGNLPVLSDDFSLVYSDGAIKLAGPIATITHNGEDLKFTTIANALEASARTGAPACLTRDTAEVVTIPAGAILDTNGHDFTGTLNGAGKIVYHGTSPSYAMPSTPTLGNSWTGTCSFTDYTSQSDYANGGTGSVRFYPDNFANENSKIEFNGCKFFISGATYKAKEIIVTDNGTIPGLVIRNGWHDNLVTFNKLSGEGTIYTDWGSSQRYRFADASAFTGTVTITTNDSNRPGIIFGDSSVPTENDAKGKIMILSGSTATLLSGKTWSAPNGFELSGTLSGTGTIDANVSLKNGATIDVTDNAEGAALTLTDEKSVTFGGVLNLVGLAEDSEDTVILKNVSSVSDFDFATVKINGSIAGRLLYDEVEKTISYTASTDDSWTPDTTTAVDGIFTWSVGSSWKLGSQTKTWANDDTINVRIDAATLSGVVIDGQITAGNVVVVCSDDQNHDFEFHNPLKTVNGTIETDETNKLTANAVLMPQYRGNLGLKVPIVGEIGFSDNTHLVFRTGTGSNVSEAYSYNVNTHGAAIIVDVTEGAGKFEVPTSMYAQKFEVKENATIIFKSTSIDITGVYSGAGKLAKMGEGTTTLVSVNLPSGGVEVLEGTLKLNRGSTNYPFWNGTALPVMVADGATLDINGCEGFKAAITLEEGATLASDDAGRDLGYENASIYSISLNGNATVRAVGDFGILRNQRGDTSFALNGHTLTKMGAGIFHLCNTTVANDSTGSIDVQAGRLAIWNKAVNVSSVDVAFADGTSLAMSANLTAHDITITGAVTITSDSTGTLSGSSIKLMTAASTLTVPAKLADNAVTTDLTGKIVVFNETTRQYYVSDAYVEKAFEAVPGSSASGWFSDWDGEKDGAARSVVTGTGMESVRIVHHDGDNNNQKWHPFKNDTNFAAKNAYTMSVYGTTDLIEAEEGKYKVLWSMGQPGNSHILATDEEGNIVFFKNANGDGNPGTQSNKISAGKLSGYHLITVTFSTTKGAAIWIDGEKKASDPAFTTAAANGLQIGGVYRGTYDPMKQGVGYVPTYIWAAEAIAPDAQIAALSADHPAVTTFNTNVEFDTNGGKLYLPSLSNTSGNLFRVKKGTLIVPKDVTATLDNIEFGDNGNSHNYGLDLDGTLNISKNSSGNCTSGDIYRQNNQNDGIVFSEWTGTGTYNIRGTFNAPNAYAELVHSSDSQPTSTFNIAGGTFTVKGITAAVTEKATINLTNGGTLNLGTNPSMENIRIVKNLTNGTVNCTSGAEYDELNVLGDVTLKYGNNSQSIRKLTIAKDATATLSTNNDQLNYAAVVAHVKGTLDCGTTRQTLFDGSKIYLYNGGTIAGAGGSNNGVTVGLDTDRDGAGVIICKNEDEDTQIATITGSLGAHDGNTGSNTITVQEGAEDVILSIPNAASLNGRMPWVIDEGVNVKFGNDKSVGSYTSLTINGNVVFDANVTETTTVVTVAEGKTITLGAGVKAVDPSLNELTRTVLAVEGLSLVAKTGETLITIDDNEYVSIDVALKHLHQGSTVVLGTGVTLEGGLIKHGDQTFNPFDYLGYEIVEAEDGSMTASRVFEDSSEVGLVFSEIMPKPVDKPVSAANPDSLARYDENGLESGWVELENKGDKWVDLANYKFLRVNRSKATSKGDYGAFPSVLIPPHSKFVFYTSERYSNSADMTASAWVTPAFMKKDKPDPRPKLYGPELHNMLVWPDKINPKKFPFVRLMKGSTIIDTVVIPSDIPEGHSIIVTPITEADATVRYMTNKPTKGTANTSLEDASIIKLGPNVGPLYEIAGGEKHSSVSEFGAVKMATPGEDYVINFSLNPTMSPTVAADFRAKDAITGIKLVYRTWGGTVDAPTQTNQEKIDVAIPAEDNFDAADQGYQYSVTIPKENLPEAGQLIQWKFEVTDDAGNEWTTPSFHNKDDGYEWYGTIVDPGETEGLTSASLPNWHMFVTSESKGQMDRDAPNQTIANNARVAIYDASTKCYYDYVRIDLRGHTSANFYKKGHGLRFSKANPLMMTDLVTGKPLVSAVRKSSLISEFGDPSYVRQMTAFWLLNKVGSPAPFDFPVHCNLNGKFYQLAFHSERFTDELIEDFHGLDKFGYGYKNVGIFTTTGTTSGAVEKKTPDDGNESDDSKLRELYPFIAESVPAAQRTANVVKLFDLPAWINYLAATRITQETDDVWGNISAYLDDAEMKEDGVYRGTGTWMPLAYDMNQSFGQWHYGDLSGERTGLMATQDWHKSHPFYGGDAVRCYESPTFTSPNRFRWNRAIDAVYQSEKFRRLYLRRLRTLMDQELGEPNDDATSQTDNSPIMVFIRQMAGKMTADATADRTKWGGLGDTQATGSAINVWPSDKWNMTQAEGIQDLYDNYIVPRRRHLFETHSINNTAKTVGYGTEYNAGIPNKQSDIATLKGTDEDPKITARYDADLGAVVIENDNEETIDISNWTLTGPISMTIPAGTVLDQKVGAVKGSVYVAFDRRATVTAFGDSVTDQVVIGNGVKSKDLTLPITLRTEAGVRVVGTPTDQELYIRLDAFYGSTLGNGDENEWFSIKNIGNVAVDYTGMTFCFLKQGDPETKLHCHVTLPEGTLAAGESKKFVQSDFASGFDKIQDNALYITITDKYTSPVQSLAVTQKDYTWAYQHGAYLEHQTDTDKWHQVWDASVQGDLVLADYADGTKTKKALAKDLYVRAAAPMTITLENPSFDASSTLKISGEGKVTITGTLNATVNTTAIKSAGNLIFADGSYTITAGDDCIQADGDITINGGTFVCHSTGNDGIDANGDIIINGGTIFAFTAATEEDDAKSTGLDVNSGHSITINGGTVIATSAEADALSAMRIAGTQKHQIVEVSEVSGQTKAIGDVIVTFPTMETSPAAVLVSTPTLTDAEITPEEISDGIEIVAADGETPAKSVVVPASWAADKTDEQKVAAAEAYVLGLAEPTEKPVVSSEQTAEADSIRIVDNVAPRFGTGVTVKRTLFVGTTPDNHETTGLKESEVEETNGGFTVPLPTEGSKVKYIKIKYSFE